MTRSAHLVAQSAALEVLVWWSVPRRVCLGDTPPFDLEFSCVAVQTFQIVFRDCSVGMVNLLVRGESVSFVSGEAAWCSQVWLTGTIKTFLVKADSA